VAVADHELRRLKSAPLEIPQDRGMYLGRNAITSRCRGPILREGGRADNGCSVNWAFVPSMLDCLHSGRRGTLTAVTILLRHLLPRLLRPLYSLMPCGQSCARFCDSG
jgi:hypothetical protein